MKRLLVVAILALLGWHGWTQLGSDAPAAPPPERLAARALPDAPASAPPVFRCDGRRYCSQMNSRAEAEFFTRHCPDVRMDGDRDGIPCENDSRF